MDTAQRRERTSSLNALPAPSFTPPPAPHSWGCGPHQRMAGISVLPLLPSAQAVSSALWAFSPGRRRKATEGEVDKASGWTAGHCACVPPEGKGPGAGLTGGVEVIVNVLCVQTSLCCDSPGFSLSLSLNLSLSLSYPGFNQEQFLPAPRPQLSPVQGRGGSVLVWRPGREAHCVRLSPFPVLPKPPAGASSPGQGWLAQAVALHILVLRLLGWQPQRRRDTLGSWVPPPSREQALPAPEQGHDGE